VLCRGAEAFAQRDDAVTVHMLVRHFLDRDDIAATLIVYFHHLREAARPGMDEHVGQRQREGLVADKLARAPDGMSEAERLLLAHEARAAGDGPRGFQHFEFRRLAARLQRRLKLVGEVEMVLDGALAASGHEDEMLDPGLDRLLDGILDDGFVNDGQHLLGDHLGRGQEAGAETGNRKDDLANLLANPGCHDGPDVCVCINPDGKAQAPGACFA